ncbi:MAG TPA: c-type cytochrome [Terriglobales bacterium]|nr:c-type cytochrome [Terriglobales bacterium]
MRQLPYRTNGTNRDKTVLLITAFLVACLAVIIRDNPAAFSRDSSDSDRGKYIVEHVAMCIQCHTPRDKNGELILSKYLGGAPIPVNPPFFPNQKWALKAPAIAGLPGYTREQGIRLLMEGITRDGRTPTPPMPPFRFTRADAEAVVSYLMSLP